MLFHDAEHGGALIDALARHGDGLPANVLPLAVNEVTQVGLEAVAARHSPMARCAVRFLLRAKPRHDIAGLHKTIALAEPILAGLGFDGARVATIETDDPDALGETLRAIAPTAGGGEARVVSRPSAASATCCGLRLRELHAAAPAPVDIVALPQGAPFGTVEVNVEGCTLCLSCVSACPTGALSDDPERPMLRFAEDACVQCGLCKATCPEKVISLKPQIDFRAATAHGRVIKQEEPSACIRCGKPFGVKSTVERVAAKLEGKHWMYQGLQEAPRRHQDVRRLPRRTRWRRRQFDPFGAPRAAAPAHHRRLSARARGKGRKLATYFVVAFARKSISALRSSAEPIVCSGILVPGV